MTTKQNEINKVRNGTHRNFSGAVLATALLAAVTGCTTYVEQPVTRTVYVPTPPPPAEAPAPAPAPVAEQTPVDTPAPVAQPTTVAAPTPAPGAVVIQTENDFYQPLSPYGEWVYVGSYGRVWRPAHVDAGWRPYTSGHWQLTDAGWYWVSDEPWAWATYHYGRWDWSVQFGWFWVPQTQWAPAWVSWREGAGYVGWAPLPPTAKIYASGSVVVGDPVIAPRYVFVEERRLLEPVHPTTVIVNNTTIVNQTVNITKVTVVNKTVVNEGPRVDVVEHASGRRIEAVPVHNLRNHDEADVAARSHNNPAAADNQNAHSQVRSEPVPVKAVLPRNAHVTEQPALNATSRPTSVNEARPREVNERNSTTRSDQTDVRGSGRTERRADAAPVITRADSKPATNLAIAEREQRPIEPPKVSPPAPRVAAPEVKPAPAPAVLPRNVHQVDKTDRPDNARSVAARRESPAPAGKPAETSVRSPRAAETAVERTNESRKSDQKAKGEHPEKPATALPAQ